MQVRVSSSAKLSSYAFACPLCRVTVIKETEPKIIALLAAAGVREVTWTQPAEMQEAHYGPPICHDDLLAFHFEVQGDSWVDQLTSR
jgi:hypothetical protein